MTERCQQASTRDWAAVLAERESPEWDEFLRHSAQCEECATEVARWQRLELMLHAMREEDHIAHPTAQQLAQFRWSPERLPLTERQGVQQHLKSCPKCEEELSFVASFDFSLLQEEPETTPEAAKESALAKGRMYLESALSQLFDALRQLILHPAFAYAIALILCIPAIRYYSISPTSETSRSPVSSRQERPSEDFLRSLPPPSAVGVPASADPAVAALTLLKQYEAAYEARDIEALSHIWEMSADVRNDLVRLFQENRHLKLLTDVRTVRVGDQGKDVQIAFRQAILRLSAEGDVYADDRGFCVADIRRRDDSTGWVITDLKESQEPPSAEKPVKDEG